MSIHIFVAVQHIIYLSIHIHSCIVVVVLLQYMIEVGRKVSSRNASSTVLCVFVPPTLCFSSKSTPAK